MAFLTPVTGNNKLTLIPTGTTDHAGQRVLQKDFFQGTLCSL